MSRYLLDTTALIDFSKGREPARSRILQMIEAGDELGVSPVNIAEFFAGVPPARRPVWIEFVDSPQYYEISSEAARQAGFFRYDFARRGATLSTMDALIAAVAQERQATIVTNSVKDYPMAGIDILPL
jgi:tRNA(fMet)-specific endonuclease VapC